MRALLVVNPVATVTTPRVRDVLVSALSSGLTLQIEQTKGRGHATELGQRAAETGADLVVVLGGDGTVNEVVNGILRDGQSESAPALAVVPGGGTNVFARALGFSRSPVEATGELLEALRGGRRRPIGLGRADDRWFTFCAGLGLDAAVVDQVETKRTGGKPNTPGLYLRSAASRFFYGYDRRHAPLSLSVPPVGAGAAPDGHPSGDGQQAQGEQPHGKQAQGDPARGQRAGHGNGENAGEPVFIALVCNTSPWTYLRQRPVVSCPQASFDTGLDVLAMRKLGLSVTLRTVGQMLRPDGSGPHGKRVLGLHDLSAVTVAATGDPMPLQVDGEYLGHHSSVVFTSIPRALNVVER
jgi:diacylglycerol kinase family enzyme